MALKLVELKKQGALSVGAYYGIWEMQILPIAENRVSATCDVDIRALQTVLIVAKKYGQVTLSDLNRRCLGYQDVVCASSPGHCAKPSTGIDFDAYSGRKINSSSQTFALLQFIAQFAPTDTGGMQAENNCSDRRFVADNVRRFDAENMCHHQHVDFRDHQRPLNIPAPGATATGKFLDQVDFNRDGNLDMVAVDGGGSMWLYPGNGSNAFFPRINIGAGWGGYNLLRLVDFNRDGNPDIVAVDPGGSMWLYPGNGSNAFFPRINIGAGWGGYSVLPLGDFVRDGNPDIVAVDPGGNMWLYPGNGSNAFFPRQPIGSGWGGFRILPLADFLRDGNLDVTAIDNSGNMYLYPGNGNNAFFPRQHIGSGWNF